MTEESALHGVDDVLAYIDKTLSNVEGQGWVWASREVAELLTDIRAGLRDRPTPTWAEVTISEVLAERDAFRAERDEAREVIRGVKRSRRFWINKSRELRGERNRARSLAVLLEQALNIAEEGM